MADRQFTYKVDIDTKSAKAAADATRAMFANSISGTAAGGGNAQTRKMADFQINESHRVANARIRDIERVAAAERTQATKTRTAQREGHPLQGTLKTGFLAYGAYLATKQAVTASVDFGRTGAQQLRTMETFKNLGDQIGVNAEDMAQAVKKASNSSISDMEAMQLSANILAQRFATNVDDISGDTAVLAKASRRLAQVYADENGDLLTTEQVFSRLVKFAREGNKELVDQFGISNQLIAETLGISTDGLRGAEGAENRWKGMVQILNEELARLGEPVDSTADRMEQAFARMTTAMDKLRQASAEPITIAIEWAAGGVEFFGGWMDNEINKLKVYQALLAQGPSGVMDDEINRLQSGDNREFLDRTFGINPNQQRNDELAGIGQRLSNLPTVADRGNGEEMLQESQTLAGMAEMYVKLTGSQDGYIAKSKEGAAVLVSWTSLMREWESGTLTSMPQIIGLHEELLTQMRELETLRANSAAATAEDFAPSAKGALAATRAEMAAALQAKTLQDVALPSAQFLVAGENIKKMNDAGIEGTGALKERHDELSRAMTAAATATDPFIRGIWAAASAMQAASLIGDVAGLMGKTYGPQAQNAVFGDVQSRLPKVEEGPEGWTETINKLFGEVTETQIAEAAEQTRLANQYAKEAQREWKQTAKEVERMFEAAADKIMSMPGIKSATPVTNRQMLETKFGVYKDQPDEYVRRARDEIIDFYRHIDTNEYGVSTERLIPRKTTDYADVTREDIERIAGAPAGLPGDVLMPLFEDKFYSGAAFADKENLKLLNMDAIRGQYEDMKSAETGRKNQQEFIMGELGISQADAALITGQQAPLVQMLTGGQSNEEIAGQLSGVGALVNQTLLAPWAVATGPSPLVSMFTGGLSNEDIVGQMDMEGLGRTIAERVLAPLQSGGMVRALSDGWAVDVRDNIKLMYGPIDSLAGAVNERLDKKIGDGLKIVDIVVARVLEEIAADL